MFRELLNAINLGQLKCPQAGAGAVGGGAVKEKTSLSSGKIRSQVQGGWYPDAFF